MKIVNGVKFIDSPLNGTVFTEVFEEDPYRFKHVKRGGIVIDLGAYIGTFTLRCAVEKNCTVYAYEPNKEACSILIWSTKLNENAKVIIHNAAVGNISGYRTFYRRLDFPTASNFNHGTYPVVKEKVKAVTLTDIFKENRLTTCDVLKIDIEYTENQIFQKEYYNDLKKAKYITMEWHNYDGAQYATILKNLGFQVELAGTGIPQPKYDPTFGGGMLYAWKKMK